MTQAPPPPDITEPTEPAGPGAASGPSGPAKPAASALPPVLRAPHLYAWADAWWPTLAFVAAITLARVAYLAWFSPFALVEDEAFYWEWSRRPDWSYQTKGPGIAWVIWLSTYFFGDVEWAVRLPAVLFSALGTLATAGLARDVFGDKRVALLAAVAYQSMPAVQVTALLVTIDGPYMACWAAACWAGWRALAHGHARAWLLLGLALAAGFLFKYTILLLPPGMALFALARRGHIARQRPLPVVLGVLAACAGLVPVLVWNAGHGWLTVRHLLGHLGLPGGDVPATQAAGSGWHYTPLWTIEFVLIQFAVAGPLLGLIVIGLVNHLRAARLGPAGWRPAGPAYLVLCALPIALFYLVVSFLTDVQANWAMAVFVSLAPAAAWAALDGVHRVDHGVRFAWHACLICLGLVALGIPTLGYLATSPRAPDWLRVRRLIGIRELAAATHGHVTALAQRTGGEPFVVAVHYGRAAQLAFYLPGKPRVYTASAHFGDGRVTQYDLWADTNLADPAVVASLRGRPAVCSGGMLSDWARAFDSVTDLGELPGETKQGRRTFAAVGFRAIARSTSAEAAAAVAAAATPGADAEGTGAAAPPAAASEPPTGSPAP